MKKRGPTFGHSQMEYRLGNIFHQALEDFNRVDAEVRALEKEYQSDKTLQRTGKLMAGAERRTEAGTVAVVMAVAWIEQNLYAYAANYFDAESYEQHLGNLRLLTRYILLPKLCQNKVVEEDHPAINDLRELVAARNAIAHPKRHDMGTDPRKSSAKVQKEIARFHAVCRKLEKTLAGLREILISKPPTAAVQK
jgi:hypothetical protein